MRAASHLASCRRLVMVAIHSNSAPTHIRKRHTYAYKHSTAKHAGADTARGLRHMTDADAARREREHGAHHICGHHLTLHPLVHTCAHHSLHKFLSSFLYLRPLIYGMLSLTFGPRCKPSCRWSLSNIRG